MNIKPIETQYKGYRFRSRLEARWAVFFDALGLKWEYEPEGYVLEDGTKYLPDFRVTSPTGLVTWYEVKPKGIKRDEKFSAFAAAHMKSLERPETDTYEDYDVIAEWTRFVLLAGDPMDWLESIEVTSGGPQGGVCPRCGTLNRYFDSGICYSDSFFADDSFSVSVGCHACDADTPGGGYSPAERGVLVTSYPHKGWLMVPGSHWRAACRRVEQAAIAARSARFEFGESGARA